MSTRRSSAAAAAAAVPAPAPAAEPAPPAAVKEVRKRAREPDEPHQPIALPIFPLVGQLSGGCTDGPLSSASFHGPMGVALAPDGALVVCDADNRRIRRVLPLTQPADIAPISSGEERRSLRGGPAADDGRMPVPGQFTAVKTVCGSNQPGCRDGTGSEVAWHDPCGVVVDPSSGVAFVVDAGSHTVRSVSPNGETRTLAGSGKAGYADGSGAVAHFCYPSGIAIGPDGTLFVSDSGNHRIRAMTQAGDVRTLSGSGVAGHKDGPPQVAQFYYPAGLTCDMEGTLFVADRANHRVRKVTPKGHVSTLAGSGIVCVADGKGAAAGFSWPNGIVVDPSPKGAVYVSDTFVFQVRRIGRDGVTKTISLGQPPPPVTVAAGSGAAGGADGASRAADGGAIVKQECEQKLAVRSQAATPTAASIKVEAATVKAPIKMQSAPVPYPFDDDSDRVNTLVSLAIDAKNGILYACEASNNRIRKLIIS